MYIAPEYRGRGIFPALVKAIRDVAEKSGTKNVCCEIHVSNEQSVKAHRRAGYRLLEAVWFFNLLGLHVYVARRVSHKAVRITVHYYPIWARSFNSVAVREHVDLG